MSKIEAIKNIRKIADEYDLFVFITDKDSVEKFNNKSIEKQEWERTIKHVNEFGDFSNILEALGNK